MEKGTRVRVFPNDNWLLPSGDGRFVQTVKYVEVGETHDLHLVEIDGENYAFWSHEFEPVDREAAR